VAHGATSPLFTSCTHRDSGQEYTATFLLRFPHEVGKEHTQKIESKHIHLRTRIKRLVRRTICFSKTTTMHDLVIGLFINRYELGVAIYNLTQDQHLWNTFHALIADK
jgi:hypothetical protein